ncbi:MAG: DnaJ domain-containing protein [Halobacteriales archaeon]
MSEDYYALLGVDQAASKEAILQAYREKAAEHHPDVSEADDAESTFQRLNEAKDVLTDDERRREYDRVGHDQYVGDSDTGPSAGPAQSRRRSHPDQPASSGGWPGGVGSVLEQFFGGPTAWTAKPRSRHFGAGSGGSRDPFVIDLEAHLGRQQTASYSGPAGEAASSPDASTPGHMDCPRCGGRGGFIHEIDTARGHTRRLEPCERCEGSGTIADPD